MQAVSKLGLYSICEEMCDMVYPCGAEDGMQDLVLEPDGG